MSENVRTPLHEYIALNEMYYRIYERYKPDLEAIAEIREARPTAQAFVASRYACPDCARNVPRMARIAEHLEGWTWEIVDSDENPGRCAELGIVRVPTFVVFDEQGRELGRIIENPSSGSLAADLLWIVGGGER